MSGPGNLKDGFDKFGLGDGEMLYTAREILLAEATDMDKAFGAAAPAPDSLAAKGQYWKPAEPAATPEAIDNFRAMVLGNDLGS